MILKINNLIVILLLALSSHAQRDLSVMEAIGISLENNYQIQISQKQLESAEKQNKWSEAGLFPTVELRALNMNTIQDNTNNPFTFTPGLILNQSFAPSLSANWNIFSGFGVRMSKQRLEQLELQSSNNSMAVIETTIQDVLKAYFTARLQMDRMVLFEDVLGLSRRRFNYYEIREKYSSSNSLESLQFKNQYLTDSTNLLMQQISYDNSIRNLLLLMNDTTINESQVVLVDTINVDVTAIDFDTALEELYSNNQNLKNQYLSLELQKTNTAMQRSFLYPTVSFQAGVDPSWSKVRELKEGLLEANIQNLQYYGNISVRYTLYNNWKNKRAVEVSKIQEEISLLNVDNMKASLKTNLRNLVDMYSLRVQLLSISEQNMIYAKKAFDLAEKRYDTGSINSIELASYQNNYQNTLIQHYENKFNKLDTFLEIYKMTGKIALRYGE